MFTYDPNGNLATKTEGADLWQYTWNVENQLTRVTKNSVEVARFSYDPLGRRVEKVAGSVTTTWTYDGEDILREGLTSGTSGTAYYHPDGLGSVVSYTGTSGSVLASRSYDAFGNLLAGATIAGHAFTGREWDPEVGLYYYRARYYDPKIGRFISEDPIGFNGGDVNLYAYVTNNPLRFTDPSGEIPRLSEKCREILISLYMLSFRRRPQSADTMSNAKKFIECVTTESKKLPPGAPPIPPTTLSCPIIIISPCLLLPAACRCDENGCVFVGISPGPAGA